MNTQNNNESHGSSKTKRGNRSRVMSEVEMLELLRKAFDRLTTEDCRCWTPHFFMISKGVESSLAFDVRQIVISPLEEWRKYLVGLDKDYVTGKRALLKDGFSFREYDGGAPEEGTAFHANFKDNVIGQTANEFANALDSADVERGADGLRENGFAISGLSKDGLRTIFVSAHTPLIQLTNRFWFSKNEYKPFKNQLLVLPKRIDVVFVGDDAWFLTLQGVQLFAPDSICKAITQSRVAEMECYDWIDGLETLKIEAARGFNPRRFVAYNKDKMSGLGVPAKRKAIAKKFGIPLTKSGNVDLSDPVAANNFIKVVCDKAMVDPFSEAPMEVSGAKKWKGA